MTQAPQNYRVFNFFGWRIYITRHCLRKRAKGRSMKRHLCKSERLRIADYHCEMCGAPIDIRCTLHHLLPVGATDRNTAQFCRVVCPVCSERIQRAGGIRHIITEGGAE
ncbi:MAG: hypothetical protein NC453_24685 [Muribaculum sp.]|nr:hypothetical protein [Muribaculum sp.]